MGSSLQEVQDFLRRLEHFPLLRKCLNCGSIEHGDDLQGAHNAVITNTPVALVRQRTMPIELTPPVGEVNANFCG
jgi:hypothetical protein